MSPAYVHSSWCARERNAFLDITRDRVADGRIFLVSSLDVPVSERPAEFGDLIGFPFFVNDAETGVPRSLGDPDPAEPAFLKQIYGLSFRLANELTRLAKRSSAETSERAAAPNAGSVFVARSTDDLEDREDEVRNFLIQAGIAVPPRRQYMQTDAGSFEAAVRADLEPSKVFVQLLSTARGPETPFGGSKRLPFLQWEVAQKLGKKIVLWRDRTIDPSTVTNPEHRQLLDSAIACPIEELKRTIAEEVKREPPRPPVPQAGVMVFVDSEKGDQALAKEVGTALASQGISCYWSLNDGTIEEARKDLEANLLDCNGVVIVYGSGERTWVRERLRLGEKVLIRRANRPVLAICQGPPPKKGDLNLAVPDIQFMDCSAGFKPEALRSFVASLRV